MLVTQNDVKYIAELAQLKFSEEEISEYQIHLSDMLNYIKKINEVDTENISPLTYPIEEDNVLCEDILEDTISTEEALLNAPSKNEKYFKVPKVLPQKNNEEE